MLFSQTWKPNKRARVVVAVAVVAIKRRTRETRRGATKERKETRNFQQTADLIDM